MHAYRLSIDRTSSGDSETYTHHYVVLLPAGAEEAKFLAMKQLQSSYPNDNLDLQSCKQARLGKSGGRPLLSKIVSP